MKQALLLFKQFGNAKETWWRNHSLKFNTSFPCEGLPSGGQELEPNTKTISYFIKMTRVWNCQEIYKLKSNAEQAVQQLGATFLWNTGFQTPNSGKNVRWMSLENFCVGRKFSTYSEPFGPPSWPNKSQCCHPEIWSHWLQPWHKWYTYLFHQVNKLL